MEPVGTQAEVTAGPDVDTNVDAARLEAYATNEFKD